MMLRVMRFEFEKTPLWLVGVKNMFFEIAEKGGLVSYAMLFKYMLGETVSLKEEEQNSEFQVQFVEHKKQDCLLHDTGVKKIFYSKDLKYYLCLDEGARGLKVYDREMKIVGKFSPSKDKHGKKFPAILHFDFDELNFRLGLILTDSTLSIVNFRSFLLKS